MIKVNICTQHRTAFLRELLFWRLDCKFLLLQVAEAATKSEMHTIDKDWNANPLRRATLTGQFVMDFCVSFLASISSAPNIVLFSGTAVLGMVNGPDTPEVQSSVSVHNTQT